MVYMRKQISILFIMTESFFRLTAAFHVEVKCKMDGRVCSLLDVANWYNVQYNERL